MRNVADVDDDVRIDDFLKRRMKRRDQLCGEIGDEADRVRKDRLVHAGQRNLPHRRVKRRKQQIFRDHGGTGQAIEQA